MGVPPPPRGEVNNTEITGQLFRTRFDLCSWLVVYVVYTSLLYFIHRVQGTSPTFYMFVVYL